MSGGYGAVREYRDDPNAPPSYMRGYQAGTGSPSILNLCEQIRSNIFQINNGANTLDRALKTIGTERDTPQTRDRIHETSISTNKVVQATARLIRNANALRGDRQQKMQIERLTSDFQESISRFQTLQKKAMEKVKTAVKLGSQTQHQKPLVDIAGFGGQDDRQPLVQDDREDRLAQLQAQETVIEDDLGLLREREERIRQLESDILDVNEIFRDLGAMISEQGEMLNDIEANVERASANVEGGNEQLVKASAYQAVGRTDANANRLGKSDDLYSVDLEEIDEYPQVTDKTERSRLLDFLSDLKKSRKKMCCLLLIFLIIAIIVVVIIVTTLKK